MGFVDFYDNSLVRRQDRLLDVARAEELLLTGEYGFLAFGGELGGYGVPLNFVFDGGALYFHCALEGEKLRRLASCGRVTFCVVGLTSPEPAKFTTGYESVLVFGTLGVVEDSLERMRALDCLVGKYSAEYRETGRKYSEKSFGRTAVMRLDVERVSGKGKR